MTVNLNSFAKEVTLKEGKKINLSIAQTKEVIKIVLQLLSKMTVADLLSLMTRIK